MSSDGLQSISSDYRCNEIDSSHYPIFHQNGGNEIVLKGGTVHKINGGEDSELALFETDPSLREETSEKQAPHTMDAVKMMEFS